MSVVLLAEHPDIADPQVARPGAHGDQRSRLLLAVARVVGEGSYAGTTVADVVRAAGVSRTTFYAEFAGKEEAFLESYRHGVDVIDARIDRAVRASRDWRDQLRAGIEAYLRALAEHPVFARAYLLQVPLAGPAALAARDEALRRFAERYRRTAGLARREHPGLVEPPADALHVLCAGTEHLAADRVRAGQAERLPELADVFCHCAESVLTGPARPAQP
ncbi:TetR/AcrR family transcriptional regulator [Patulibacter defluvii]|uniref:TetR/AcrR family transcriptional regulator n=1 Tax=Patulibacter defluvii TaxID=3095358 RepID=UPI002A75C2C6|nr:TetR/AcrR family transcriptional regulator [Patulibacter sp. DM4]